MIRIRQIVGLLAFGFTLSASPHLLAAPPDKDSDPEKHWAFSPVKRPELPNPADPSWDRNPIDRFVSAKMEAEGVKPVAEADRRSLIRRISLDLIGLPPTPAEVDAFLADKSPGAVAKVVDDLMARPQYGERWARHWLDVARYSESNGYERDGAKPYAWRYRDYVIDAFNQDKPYDRFLTEQLAGDEIEGSDANSQIATTFLRLGTWDDEPADRLVDRYDQLDDVLGTTASAFLGVTLRCARCHDHKFEPFSQADYYRMLSVFEPLKRPQNDRYDLDHEVGSEPALAAYREGKARVDADFARVWARVEALAKPEIEQLLAPGEKPKDGKPRPKRVAMPKEAFAAFRTEGSKRSQLQRDLVRKFAEKLEEEVRKIAPDEVKAALKPLDERLKAVAAAMPPELPRAYVWYEEKGAKVPETHLLKRGDPTRPAELLGPGIPAVMATGQPNPPKATLHSTGRRLWLARWLTAPENPLAARVIVNRIWQFHFGEGLVSTSNDFGVMGEAPSHPELLDWLAAEFVSSGWRFKPLHRMIILSQTYQRSSSTRSDSAEVDPRGAFLWRWRQHRLEAEAVRDSILAVSGQLNPRMGGPSVYPTLPEAVLAGQSRPGDGWGKSEGREQARRSIYIFAKRSLGVPELELLDSPDSSGSCEHRIVSTTGPQALTFLNGAFVHEQAGHFADRLIAEVGKTPADHVSRAFALALGRPPRPEESRAALEFLDKQAKQIDADTTAEKAGAGTPGLDPRRKALEAFCLAIFNMNEFVYSN